MADQTHSLAAYKQGHLSLKDFEWEPHLRPSSAKAATAASDFIIPEIDLQPLYEHKPNHGSAQSNPDDESGRYAELVKSLSQAAASYGFFQVFNHNISLSALEALYAYERRFFSLPLERKYGVSKLFLHPSAGPFGYACGNTAGDSPNKWWTEAMRIVSSDKEVLQSLAEAVCSHQDEQQAFSDLLVECTNGFAKLAQELTVMLLEGLSLNGKEMVEKYIEAQDIAGLKFNHYPACPQPNMTLGLPPHSDVSILTLLWQDQVGGLQVHVDGEWITVKPRHDALVVNIGDFLQVWSNDRYPSIKHRAILNSTESRYSMGYFYYTGVDSMLCPFQELLEKTKECSKFRSALMSEHRTYVYSEVSKGESKGVDYLKC